MPCKYPWRCGELANAKGKVWQLERQLLELREAIHKMCLECIYGTYYESRSTEDEKQAIEKCAVEDCPLYNYRKGEA